MDSRIPQEVFKLLEQIQQKVIVSDDFDSDLLVEINNAIMLLDDGIKSKFVDLRSKYLSRFPELSTVNISLFDYSKCVLLIGETEDLSFVDFSHLGLPSSALMILTMCSKTTTGKPLSKSVLDHCLSVASFIISASDAKTKLLGFIEGQMTIVAPSLTAIVGSAIAAKLIGSSGGIRALSSMPAGNILALGSAAQTSKLGIDGELAGFSKSMSSRSGFISSCDLVAGIRQEEFKIKAIRCALAARFDADHFRENISHKSTVKSEYGFSLRKEIEKKIEKMLEPPPIQKPKPLQAPKEYAKQRRGGKRVRKQKESVSMTELRRLQNRITFGVAAEQEIIYGDESIGLGQVVPGDHIQGQIDEHSQIHLPKANTKARESLLKKGHQMTSKFSLTSGIISSLSINSRQGIQLQNPEKTGPLNKVKGILTSTPTIQK